MNNPDLELPQMYAIKKGEEYFNFQTVLYTKHFDRDCLTLSLKLAKEWSHSRTEIIPLKLVFQWSCFYCEKGKVSELPSKCPECGEELKKSVEKLSTEEMCEALDKKNGGKHGYSLAS